MDTRKNSLINIIEGYHKANQLIKTEKRMRLAALTEKDALSEYNDLCETWELNFNKDTLWKLDGHKTQMLIQRRQIIDKVSRNLKY